MKKEINWQNNLDNISPEMIDFALNEAKEKLNNTNITLSDLHKKAFFILNGLFIAITIIAGFFFNHIELTENLIKQNWFFIFPYLILIIGFLISFFRMLFFFKATSFHTGGNSPNELLGENRTKDIKYLKACCLSSYNERIKDNLSINKNKGVIINNCLKIIYSSLSISILIFILILYLALGQAHLILSVLVILLFGILLMLNYFYVFLYKI